MLVSLHKITSVTFFVGKLSKEARLRLGIWAVMHRPTLDVLQCFLSQGALSHCSPQHCKMGGAWNFTLSSAQKVHFLRWRAEKEERRNRDTKQSLALLVSFSQGSFCFLDPPESLPLIPTHSSSFSLPCLMGVIYIFLFSTFNFRELKASFKHCNYSESPRLSSSFC